MLKNGIMSLIFKDIGIFKMDGVHIDESVKIWLAGFKNNYLQVFNYLEDTNKNVALGSSGIIEITFKNPSFFLVFKYLKVTSFSNCEINLFFFINYNFSYVFYRQFFCFFSNFIKFK